MPHCEYQIITATTDAAGAATAYSGVINGVIAGIFYAGGFATTVDFTITGEDTGQAILAASNVAAAANYWPEQGAQSVLGAALTIGGSGGVVGVPVVLANERIKFVVAQGGNANVGQFQLAIVGALGIRAPELNATAIYDPWDDTIATPEASLYVTFPKPINAPASGVTLSVKMVNEYLRKTIANELDQTIAFDPTALTGTFSTASQTGPNTIRFAGFTAGASVAAANTAAYNGSGTWTLADGTSVPPVSIPIALIQSVVRPTDILYDALSPNAPLIIIAYSADVDPASAVLATHYYNINNSGDKFVPANDAQFSISDNLVILGPNLTDVGGGFAPYLTATKTDAAGLKDLLGRDIPGFLNYTFRQN